MVGPNIDPRTMSDQDLAELEEHIDAMRLDLIQLEGIARMARLMRHAIQTKD